MIYFLYFYRFYNCSNKTIPTILCGGTLLWLNGEKYESEPHNKSCQPDKHAKEKLEFKETLKSKLSKGCKVKRVYDELAQK